MKQLVMKTKNGVELYYDDVNYEYTSTDMDAVMDALEEDVNNESDPTGAKIAASILNNMVMCDRYHDELC